MARKKIFTWHIHGSYLFYLSQGDFDIYIPVREARDEGYYGRGLTFPFGANVIEVPASEVKTKDFDVILYQTDKNYIVDQFEILSEEQRKLPRVFLKHDAPPENNIIVVDDPDVMVVHVTFFNRLMWNNQNLKTKVIFHGVTDNGYKWLGGYEKGIAIINNLTIRGRQIGADIFKLVRNNLPLDIIGMGNEDLGGFEVLHPFMPDFIANYRFVFNPVRYSSFPLAVCEAMMAGLPVVTLSTTELPSLLKDNENAIISNDIDYLMRMMSKLLKDKELAVRLSENSRKTALMYFGIDRFINQWNEVFSEVMNESRRVDIKSY